MMAVVSLCLAFVSFIVVCTAIPQYANNGREETRSLQDILGSRARRRFCKEQGESCRGLPKCCDSMVCYWEDGYSALRSGVCVQCVGEGALCQRDTQCCSDLVCQKASGLYVDGTCRAKRASGAECHDDDQCRSDKCNIRWIDNIKGYGGKCE